MKTVEDFKQHSRKFTDIRKAMSVLSWDQETHLPKKAATLRAQQIATLAGVAYDLSVQDDYGQLLQKLNDDNSLTGRDKKNVQEAWKGFRKRKKLSTDFVLRMSECSSRCFNSWVKARSADDFSIYAADLSDMVDIKREQAELLGYSEHPYDALLDEFEPGSTAAELEPLFEDVRSQLVDFVKEIAASEQVETSWLSKHYDKDKQWDFGLELLKQMGYDFEAGRQDIAAHPFTTDFGATDVRVTTRVNEQDIQEMVFSCIHEGGHAVYEQGLRVADYGLATGEAISLGIHESQSRLYENNVGRSLPYWQANMDLARKYFPENLNNVSPKQFYKSCNQVKPSLIRTNADELTYHFHILIRFAIEKAIIGGEIEVNDIPQEWNRRYKEYLNIDVPSDAMGCMQDIHWAHGGFGYFPTYSLGSFYAAQFFKQAQSDHNDLDGQIASGELLPLLAWLRKNVHDHGKMYSSAELCQRITGEKLNFLEACKRFLEQQFGQDLVFPIYQWIVPCPKNRIELIEWVDRWAADPKSFVDPVGSWDVIPITDFSHVLSAYRNPKLRDFDEELIWDMSNATNMSKMFGGCRSFTGRGLKEWKVSNVTNMELVFFDCHMFIGDVSEWDTSSVVSMHEMFAECKLFDGDVSEWRVHNVTIMSFMFANCHVFNGDVSDWDTSNVTNIQ